MAAKTFRVPNISCNHCVMTIQRELGELEGVTSVKADAGSKTVAVEWTEIPAGLEAIRTRLAEINFPPAAD